MKETQVPPSCLWWIKPDGSSYHRARSSFPQTRSPSILVFLIPTRPSPLSTQVVVSSKPSSWTGSLQIHWMGPPSPDPIYPWGLAQTEKCGPHTYIVVMVFSICICISVKVWHPPRWDCKRDDQASYFKEIGWSMEELEACFESKALW